MGLLGDTWDLVGWGSDAPKSNYSSDYDNPYWTQNTRRNFGMLTSGKQTDTSRNPYDSSWAQNDKQNQLAQWYQQQMAAQGPTGPSAAELQMQQGLGRTTASNFALMRSQPGMGAGQSARLAANANSNAASQLNQQTGILRANESMQQQQFNAQRQQQLAGAYQGLLGQQVGQQAQSAQQQWNAEQAYKQMLLQKYGMDVGTMMGMAGEADKSRYNAEALRTGLQMQAQQSNNAMWGGLLQTAGTVGGFMLGGPAGAAAGGYLGGQVANGDGGKTW